MKRALSLILTILMVLSVTACGVNLPPSVSTDSDSFWGSKITDEETKTEETLPAYFKDPEPESVINTEKWGNVPVNQIIVVFEDNISKDQAQKTIEQIGGTIVGELGFINLYQLETNYTTEAELIVGIDAAFDLDGVEFAFPNAEIYLSDTQGTPCSPLKDPVFGDPDNAAHYGIIGMENAWKIIKGSGVELSKVKVGVLDTAIYSGTNEFNGKIKVSGDTTDDAAMKSGVIVTGGLSHATMVTHVIAADHENSGMVGIASILDENLQIDVKNLFDGQPDTQAVPEYDEDDITQGIWTNGTAYTIKALAYLKEQVKDGATVINCSFGEKELSDDFEWTVKAYEKFFKSIQKTHPHVVFVAAAGNKNAALNGKNNGPGGIKLPNVITVGSINNDGSKAGFSNIAADGGEVTLSAPGVEMMLGVDDEGKPIKASGTSFSAPQVAAAIALIQSINPELNAGQIKEILVKTSAPGITTGDQSIPIPEGMGAGVLKVDQAVLKVINEMREKQDLAPYSIEQLVGMNTVTLSAAGGPKEYTVTAGIPEALGQSASVKIEVSGQHILSGDITQTVPAGAAASWDITIAEESVFIRVTRLDNGGCATLSLDPTILDPVLLDLTGLWTGTAILVGGDDVEDIEPDNPINLSLSFNNNAGTANVQGFSTNVIVSNDGTNLDFALSETKSLYGIKLTSSAVFTGTVTTEGDGLSMSGTMTLTLKGEGNTVTYYYDWSAYR